MNKIAWTERTWNPVTGCTEISDGCKNCYAKKMAKRLQAMDIPKYRNGFDVTIHKDALNQPALWGKPALIFVCSMSDLFHDDVPPSFIFDVFRTMEACHQHTFQVLTKRSKRLVEFASRHGIPPNVWVGVTVENQAYATLRIPRLLQIEAKVRFLSCEPLLGPLDLRHIKSQEMPDIDALTGANKLDWVICGGESGHNARPINPDWAIGLQQQCSDAGVSFFFKQWGEWQPECGCEKTHRTTPRPAPGSEGLMYRCGKNSPHSDQLLGQKYQAWPNILR